MDFPKKAEDNLNNLMIVVIGIAGAALVYASVIWFQSYYRTETREVENRRNWEGLTAKVSQVKNAQRAGITEYRSQGSTYVIPISRAKELVLTSLSTAKDGYTIGSAHYNLVPSVGPQTKASYPAVYGRPSNLPVVPVTAKDEGKPTQ